MGVLAGAAALAGAALAPFESARAQVAALSQQEAGAGLRETLGHGVQAAVASLGRPDGFFGNAQVKIPLPESAQRVERLMRGVGLGRQADELILTLNRAAEAAVPEARALLVEAVKKMTLEDAKAILSGGQDSATQYFRRTTGEELARRFLPIVQKATRQVKLAEMYNEYAGKGVRFGLVDKADASLDHYVTQKALDGLFFMIAQEEQKLRDNPAQAATRLLRKVFGALR